MPLRFLVVFIDPSLLRLHRQLIGCHLVSGLCVVSRTETLAWVHRSWEVQLYVYGHFAVWSGYCVNLNTRITWLDRVLGVGLRHFLVYAYWVLKTLVCCFVLAHGGLLEVFQVHKVIEVFSRLPWLLEVRYWRAVRLMMYASLHKRLSVIDHLAVLAVVPTVYLTPWFLPLILLVIYTHGGTDWYLTWTLMAVLVLEVQSLQNLFVDGE